MQKWISTISELSTYLVARGVDPHLCDLPDAEYAPSLFPMRIPYYYADLIDWQNPQDPLRLMVLPSGEEKKVASYELADPIGDGEKEVVSGLIHRYPDRCLLLLTSHCLVHCRFCFRREVVGKARPVDFEKIRAYLEEHAEIKEIIFSGGDPGTFPAGFLQNIQHQLGGITHIKRWRFHTRVPAVAPDEITQEWLEVISQFPGKKIIIIHINHPRELLESVKKLIKIFLKHEILVLSQTVLLKGVNADPITLKELFENLVQSGVKPYYLHHLDLAKGTSHFRISIEAGKNIFKELRGNLSSVCMPEYVVDLPGGFGKVPVMWLEHLGKQTYKAKTFENKEVIYTDFAE